MPYQGPDPGKPGRAPLWDHGCQGKGKAGSHYTISIQMDEGIHLVQCLQKQPGAEQYVPFSLWSLPHPLQEAGCSLEAGPVPCTPHAHSEPTSRQAGPGWSFPPPPRGGHTAHSQRPLFGGKKGSMRGLDATHLAGVLVGTSMSHGYGRVAPEMWHLPVSIVPPDSTEPCLSQARTAPQNRHVTGHGFST